MKLKKFKMTEDELEDAKTNLSHCELQRDESDLNVAEMEELLAKKIPTKLLEDDIAEIKKQIKEKKVLNSNGIDIELTDVDVESRMITLKKMQKKLKMNIPERQLRLKLNVLKNGKKRFDAPELQINKIKKNIRDKAFYQPDTKQVMPGVN